MLPHAPDAWIDPGQTQIGYEISFSRYFYQPKHLRTLAEIRADILALEWSIVSLEVDVRLSPAVVDAVNRQIREVRRTCIPALPRP